jgi:hypothetical protein
MALKCNAPQPILLHGSHSQRIPRDQTSMIQTKCNKYSSNNPHTINLFQDAQTLGGYL